MEASCATCRFAARCLPLGRRTFVTQLLRPEVTVRGGESPMASTLFDALEASVCRLGNDSGLDAVAALQNELGRYGIADAVEIVLEEV